MMIVLQVYVSFYIFLVNMCIIIVNIKQDIRFSQL